jgi:transcription antitermination factor NusG
MPILAREPDFYPFNLWENCAPSSSDDECTWWCLHAKPRQEKAIAREVHNAEVAYCLPQAKKDGRTPQGRRIESIVPLFPGYMFLRGKEQDRPLALRGDRIVAILEVPDQC